MKKLLAVLSSILLLSGCSALEPIQVKGEVVSCSSIKTGESTSLPLECLDGGPGVAVDAIRGPAIVNVWGTWCYPCREELPHFAHFLAKYHEKVAVIGIAVEEKNTSSVKKFVESHGMSWPILYDANGTTKEKFGMGVPVTWFIDQDGKVVHKQFGPFKSTEELEIAAIKYLGIK